MRMRLWTAAVALSATGIGAATAADIAALERQLDEARKAAPIEVQAFTPVTKPARYYGDYQPRKDANFRKGEQMHFYAEPKNLVIPKGGDGVYKMAFDVDLEVSGNGQSMKQERFVTFNLDSRSRIQDLFLNLDVSLNNAPAGKYNVKFTLHDKNSKKTASFGQDVTVK